MVPSVAARQVVATETAPMDVRQAAAVNFKNHVKRYWAPGRDARSLGNGVDPAMPDAEKVTFSSWSSLFLAAAEVLPLWQDL